MTHRRPLTHRPRTDRQQGEAAKIAGTGEPHDPTNSVGVKQDAENEVPWSPTTCLQLDQDDQDTQDDQVT